MFEPFPRLRALFYCEFDHIQGPKVSYEVPEGFINQPLSDSPRNNSKDHKIDFDSISDYLIPKAELCNRLVCISTYSHKVLGFPVMIVNSKYPRNALIFNLCFVFDKNSSIRCYEQVVKKMATMLQSLELESGFLSNEISKTGLSSILEQMREDLNSYYECQIFVNDANTFDIKLFPILQDPPQVYNYQVPVLTLDFKTCVDKHWDLTMRRILPFINGVNSVKVISLISGVNLILVKLAIRHLLYYQCAQMVDIFQFSNIYTVTAKISDLLSSQSMQLDCQQFVTPKNGEPVSTGLLFSLYCSLKGGSRLYDWMRENPIWTSKIDVRRFILYGLLKGIIYRVYKYPILYSETRSNSSIVKYLDGRHHTDMICTELGISMIKLEKELESLPIRNILK